MIGSGKVGSALGAWSARAGHEVAFTSRRSESAERAAQAAGHGAKTLSLPDLIAFAQLILLTLPYNEIEKTLAPVRSQLVGKYVVDVSNPITPDHRELTIGHTMSGAETIARAIPGAIITKAFNAVFAEVYQSQNPQRDNHRISVLFAGDDANAKSRVKKLIEDLGFDAVDAGPLHNARYLEPLSLLNIHLGRVLGYGTDIGFALLR